MAGDRPVTAMRVLLAVVIIVALGSLSTLSGIGADAPGSGSASAHFTAEIDLAATDYQPGASSAVSGGRNVVGEIITDRALVASDPRISGMLTTTSDIAFRFIPDGEVLTASGRAEIVNRDGAWTGSHRSIEWQRGMRVFAADVFELRGTGRYSGLSAVFTIDLRSDPPIRGAIFDGLVLGDGSP